MLPARLEMSNYRGDAGWGFNMIHMNIIHVYSCHSSKIYWIFQIFKPSSNNLQTIFKQSSNNLQTIHKFHFFDLRYPEARPALRWSCGSPQWVRHCAKLWTRQAVQILPRKTMDLYSEYSWLIISFNVIIYDHLWAMIIYELIEL